MLNTLNINLKTDIKTDRPTTLPITLMSQDKNNNQFILRFTNGGEPVNLDDTYTVEILTKFSKSGSSRLTSATVRQDYATWEFDTAYITQDETVYNYVYVRKSGNLVVSADANCFVFSVDLSEIDKGAGRVAEVYDENYENYLDEFKDNVDFEEIAQAESDRQANEDIRQVNEFLREESYEQKVDTAIVEADVVEKVDNKVTELTPQINNLTAQLAETAESNINTRNIINSTKYVTSSPSTIVTFIDDDGYDGALDILKPMAIEREVPYVVALRGDSAILQTEGKRSQLRDLQNNYGWEMASHTMSHIHLNSSADKEQEDDSRNFLRLMDSYGLNVESIVYPWGEIGNTSVLSKYYRAGFGTSNGINNNIHLDDFNIGREQLGNSSARDLQFFKNMVDSIEGKPIWLVFMTHVSDPTTDVKQISDVMDYVISKGIPIVNAREGLNMYGSLISSRETRAIDTLNFRIKPNGIISSTRYLMNSVGIPMGNAVTSETPPSDFGVGVVTTSYSAANRGNLPFGGVLVTNKASVTRGYVTQTLYGISSSTTSIPLIYYRVGVTTSDVWSNWTALTGFTEGAILESTPASNLPLGETIKLVVGWSIGNGTIKTIRSASNVGYAKQIFYKALGTDVYIRAEDAGGNWGAWKKITVV